LYFLKRCGMLKKIGVKRVNVMCHKCRQRGEVSHNGEVVARLEEMVAKLKEALTEVAIVEYAA